MNEQVYVNRSVRVATISDSLPFQLNILASLLFEPVATCAQDAACALEGGDVLVRAREGPPLLAGMVDRRMGAKNIVRASASVGACGAARAAGATRRRDR